MNILWGLFGLRNELAILYSNLVLNENNLVIYKNCGLLV